jgi:hypothetical protein
LFRVLAQSMELLLKEMPECRTEHGLVLHGISWVEGKRSSLPQ